MIEEFREWRKSKQAEIGHISEIMSLKLSDEPPILVEEISEAESWYSRTGFLLSEANGWLDKATFFYLKPKDKTTDLDRRLELDSVVSDIRMIRDYLQILLDGIKQRVIMGESVLRHLTQLREAGVISRD